MRIRTGFAVHTSFPVRVTNESLPSEHVNTFKVKRCSCPWTVNVCRFLFSSNWRTSIGSYREICTGVRLTEGWDWNIGKNVPVFHWNGFFPLLWLYCDWRKPEVFCFYSCELPRHGRFHLKLSAFHMLSCDLNERYAINGENACEEFIRWLWGWAINGDASRDIESTQSSTSDANSTAAKWLRCVSTLHVNINICSQSMHVWVFAYTWKTDKDTVASVSHDFHISLIDHHQCSTVRMFSVLLILNTCTHPYMCATLLHTRLIWARNKSSVESKFIDMVRIMNVCANSCLVSNGWFSCSSASCSAIF